MTLDGLSSLTVHELRVFVAVTRADSLTIAADLLDLSVSTVSAHIRTLERVLGLRLFDRSRGRRGMRLTPEGQLMLETSTEVLSRLDATARRLDLMRQSHRDVVRLGCTARFAEWVLAEIYPRFSQTHPEIEVKITVNPSPRTEEALIQGQLDLGAMLGPVHNAQLEAQDIGMAEDFVLVAKPGHPMAGELPAPFRDLETESLLLPPKPAGGRSLIELEAQKQGSALQVSLEVTGTRALAQAAASGLGVAGVYRTTAEQFLLSGKLVLLNVEGFPLRSEWSLAWTPLQLSQPVILFREQVLKRAAEMHGSSVIPARGEFE